jgi:hypothetical protein
LNDRNGYNGDLNHSSVELVAEAKSIAEVLKKADTDLEQAKKEKLIEIQDIYQLQVERVETLGPKVNDNLNALRKKIANQGGKSRSTYQLDYQKVRRCNNELVSGGHAEGFAKLVAPFSSALLSGALEAATCGVLVTNPVDPSEFDQFKPTLFTGPKATLVQNFRGYLGTLEGDFLEKEVHLAEQMAKNPKWKGASMSVSASDALLQDMLSDMFGFDVFSHIAEGGGRVWMRRFYNNSKNSGNSSNCLPGVASFYFAMKSQTFMCVLIPMAPLLGIGVNGETCDKACDQEATSKLVNGMMVVTPLQQWDILYVPPGYVVYTFNPELNVKGVKGFTPSTASFVHIPCALKLDTLSSEVLAYVKTTNVDYMSKKTESSMWSKRLEFFRSLLPADKE